MNLTIKNIGKNNYDEIVNLKVANDQADFIETVADCLEEASQDVIWKTVGLYEEDRPVGFAMYGLFINEGEKGRVWLDRFLISYENQGKGYGEAGVRLLINQLYREYGYNQIYLSVYDNNKVAIALYKKIGFEFNGEVDINGEKVMVIHIS